MWNIIKTVKKGKYNYAIVRGHPNATKNGYVLEHRIIMENEINRLLKEDEVVHHKDGNSKNNVLSNLELMTKKYHSYIHSNKNRVYVRMKCPQCGNIFIKRKYDTMLKKGTSFTTCSRSCAMKLSRHIVLYGMSEEIKHNIDNSIIEVFINEGELKQGEKK